MKTNNMKVKVKKQQKKYPYKKSRSLFKGSILTQIHAYNQRIKQNLPNYAIIDKKGKIIEKYRLRWTADVFLKKLEKEKLEKLRICKLDENGVILSK